MGQTVNLALPYPELGEPSNVPLDMKELADRIEAIFNAGQMHLPAGMLAPFAGSVAPPGWLLCDGAAVGRTTYPALFAAIGTTWGAGDGSGTFNVPDLRGRAPLGAGAGPGLTSRALGAKAGAESVVLAQSHMADHTHAGVVNSHAHGGGTGVDGPDHSHGSTNAQYFLTANLNAVAQMINAADQNAPIAQDAIPGSGGANVRHTHAISAEAPGCNTYGMAQGAGGAAHENMPPFAVVTYIVKT